MKKTIYLIFAVFFQVSFLQAQDIEDVVQYGSDNLDGTARFVSMSGAFGALGGDLSALKINPAGSAVFLQGQAAFSIDNIDYKNATDFTTDHTSSHNNKVDLNQAGAVFVWDNGGSKKVNRFALGIGYDRNGTNRNHYNAVGISNQTVGDYFLGLADGRMPLDLLVPLDDESFYDLYDYLHIADEGIPNAEMQTAYLGYESRLFDAIDEEDFDQMDYVSNVGGSSFDHFYRMEERGLNGTATLNAGLAVQDWLFFGLNLKSHFIDYRRTTYLYEDVLEDSDISEIDFVNNLDTRGSGFSFQLGGIAKLNDMWRIGLSYESPTWLRVEDETWQYVRTDGDAYGEILADPEVINVNPHYNMRTPGRINASVAAVFGGKGLLSFDYSYKDFSESKFSSAGFGSVNDQINEFLQEVNTYRIGGEYRLKQLSLRAGYRYEDSPYTDHTMGPLRGYTAGLGWDFGGVKLDFAYGFTQRDYNSFLFNTGFTDRASIRNDLSHYVLTLVFDL